MPPEDVFEGDQTVGARIAALRKARGLSQSTLGRAVGVSFQQVGKYEKGQNRLGSSRLQQIAEFFDVPVSTLFSDEVETTLEIRSFASLLLPGATDLLTAFAEIECAETRRDVLVIARTAARISANAATGDR